MRLAKVTGRRRIETDEVTETLAVSATTRVTAERAVRRLADCMATSQMLILKAEVIHSDMERMLLKGDREEMARRIERNLWLSIYDAVKKKLGLDQASSNW